MKRKKFIWIDGEENAQSSQDHSIGYQCVCTCECIFFITLTVGQTKEYSFFFVNSIMSKIKPV
jgi:hypothetical protein